MMMMMMMKTRKTKTRVDGRGDGVCCARSRARRSGDGGARAYRVTGGLVLIFHTSARAVPKHTIFVTETGYLHRKGYQQCENRTSTTYVYVRLRTDNYTHIKSLFLFSTVKSRQTARESAAATLGARAGAGAARAAGGRRRSSRDRGSVPGRVRSLTFQESPPEACRFSPEAIRLGIPRRRRVNVSSRDVAARDALAERGRLPYKDAGARRGCRLLLKSGAGAG
ncbi:hypothetical protein EVAR_66894_1 [Eumeta japonica]|uniref:Uncharacterized protein n=1 Tax=Eumeta variegata TaxID=151549 RepID=A0A4C2AG28_EUMVA|nr:hypothetical protein EVAR_66894_1 [Eumeta japonica]